MKKESQATLRANEFVGGSQRANNGTKRPTLATHRTTSAYLS